VALRYLCVNVVFVFLSGLRLNVEAGCRVKFVAK
jgi:hypothetical protein